MRIEVDGVAFDFTDALDAFIFDEKDRSKPTFHGQPMKAVDVVAEFEDAYVYVEVKDFYNPEIYNEKSADDIDETALRTRRDYFKWLKNYLKYKYRDSYLFRHAENKVDKPIHYICLLNFDNALNVTMKKALSRELPVGVASKRWQRKIATSCQVVNMERWNANFPKWPISRISTGAA